MRAAGAVAVAELLRCALAADDITDAQIEIIARLAVRVQIELGGGL